MNDFISSFQTLKVNVIVKSKILVVEFNRPKSFNAMNEILFEEIRKLFENIRTISNEVDIRVIIVKGAGKHFTSGLDLKSEFAANLAMVNTQDIDVGRKAYLIYNAIKNFQNCLNPIEKCHIPVIAAVHGYCLGGGVNLIPCCDITYCTKDALFSVKETTIGMVADIGALQRITKNNGNVTLLKKLSFTGEFFSAETAEKLGIVNEVVEDQRALEKKVFEVAEKIAERSPLVNWGIKRVINFSRENPINESLEYVATLNGAFLQSSDVDESVKAVITKSKAILPKL